MKVRNIIIIALAVACVGLAVTLGLMSRKYVPQTTTSEQQTQAQLTTQSASKNTKTITLALSEYRAYLTWQAVDGADGYYVYYDDGSGWQEYGKTQNCEFRNKKLQGGTSYIFGIKTYSVSGEKEVISDKFIYTIGGNTLPDTPQVTVQQQEEGFAVSWKAVERADEYIVYSMAKGESKWQREAITKDTDYLLETAPADAFYVAVRAVRHADTKKYVSDYEKTYVTTEKTSGLMYSCGDSIALGVGSHYYSYAHMFAENHNLELVNKATSGSQLSSEHDNVDHICENIMKQVDELYDYVFIEGGNNDYYFNAKLGNVTAAGTEKFDMNTTCGALESALTYLQKECPQTKVVFVLMHNADGSGEKKNKLGFTFTDYADAIRAVCKKYNVALADCFKDSGFDTADTKLCEQYTFKFNGVFPQGDGVHPLEEAYVKFYMPYVNKAAES